MKKTPTKKKYRALFRPAALLLAVILCLGGSTVYHANGANGALSVIAYYDTDGSGHWDTNDLVPTGAFTLGFSDTGGRSYSLSTIYDSTGPFPKNTVVLSALPAGTYRLNSLSQPPADYGATLQVSYAEGSSPASVSVGQTFQINGGGTTKLTIKLLRSPPAASISGRLAFADDAGTDASGFEVALLDGAGNVKADSNGIPLVTVTGSGGAYTFTGLSPGSYWVQAYPLGERNGIRYQIGNASTLCRVNDGEAATGIDFTVTRVATVDYWMGGARVAQVVDAPLGQKLEQPTVASSYLDFSGGRHVVNGWYRDAARTTAWSFATDTVAGPTNLYMDWRTVYDLSGSGSNSGERNSSRGNNRRDVISKPEIKTATATINGATATLTVVMESVFDLFDYQWLVMDNNTWRPIPDGNTAVATYGGVAPDTTYQFKVVVNHGATGAQVESGVISVRSPATAPLAGNDAGTAAPPSGSGGGTYVPPSSTWGAAPTLSQNYDGAMYDGARLEITPSIPGGTWSWDTHFSVEERESGVAVLTALKDGTGKVSYTANGRTASLEVEILPSQLPAVGQSITPVIALSGAGALLLLLAAALELRRRKEARHG